MKRIAVTALLVLAACDHSAGPVKTPPPSADGLMVVDREFDAYTAAHGIADGFRAYVDANVVSLPEGGEPVLGRDALFARQSKTPKSAQLRWQPRFADISASGDLGYTWGTYTFRMTTDAGKRVEENGKYCTIWKRQADGSWKAALDVGNASAPVGK